MPEHIRALVVVLVLGGVVWMLVRPAMLQIVSSETFARWRGLWLVTTLAWFLSHSFWLYVGIVSIVLLQVGRREANVFGLYLLLLLAAPPRAAPIPGFGIVDHIFMLDHYRLLALVLLLPHAWRLSRRPATVRLLQSPVDWLVLGYLALNSVLAFRGGNITSDARTALMLWIDYFLPYYVASRSIRTMEGFRHALVGLVMGGVLLSGLAVIEVMRSWKLYDAASAALGLNPMVVYKTRGAFVRPGGTSIDAIVLGYVMVLASGSFLYLQRLINGRLNRWLGWISLATGVLASLSRGPWVGAGLLVFVFLLTGRRPFMRLIQAFAVSIGLLLALSSTPAGQQFIELLPFVGQEEQGNVEYRANLLSVSLPVIERNLLLGSSNFLDAPELQVMRQGEGIIDIVNSYLAVALHSGLIGLILFLGLFVRAIQIVWRGMRSAAQTRSEDERALGRALFASVISIAFIIFTVSGIYMVPTIYFIFVGLSSAYFLMVESGQRTQSRDTE